MRYQDIRQSLKTGDVIAFSGKGRVSEIIKWRTNSEYSHVGVVLDTTVNELGKTIFLVESTSLINIPDEITKELWKGVQIHILSNRLKSYDGKAWVLPLKYPLKEQKKIEMQRWLRSIHEEKIPYDTIQAIGAGADLLDRLGLVNQPDFSSLFCSELVTKALQIADVVPPCINPSEATPADVAKFSCFDIPIGIC